MWVPKVRNIFLGLCAKGQTHLGSAAPSLELHSFYCLAIHMPFSTPCWGSSRGRVGDSISMCLVMVSPCLSLPYCHSHPLHWPCQLSTVHTVSSPSGFANRALRFWLEIVPCLFPQASPQLFLLAHPPLLLIFILFYSSLIYKKCFLL